MSFSILVIDDDEQLRNLLNEFLTNCGYTVFEAEDGEVGLSLYEAKQPNLIITDIIMPVKEGIEFIQKIRDRTKTIPIIAMSGGMSRHSDSYLRVSKKLGANEVLSKPFDLDQLLATIKSYLK